MAKIVTIPSVRETLKALKPGVWTEFEATPFKPNTIRSAASVLQKDGYLFECSDKGMITGIKVRRLK